ncbi:MAG TPA: hypothetical protein VM284_07290 [Candidatus Limnocylindria bacterium]|nr:hypothetical protein [Candidatus Limnocylindria bacterium]
MRHFAARGAVFPQGEGRLMGFPSAPPPPAAARKSPTTIIAVFVGGMLALAVLAILFVLFNQPTPPAPECQPGKVCAPAPSLPPVNGSPAPGVTSAPTTAPASLPPGATAAPFVPPPTPVSNAPIILSGEVWRSSTLNYSFEYDPTRWELQDGADDDTAVFYSVRFDAQMVVQAVTAQTSPAEMIARQLGVIDTLMVGRVKDTDDYDALLGPSIGFVDGEGDVWSGVLLSSDGTPVAPGGVTVLAATDGRLTVGIVVLVGSPDAQVGSGTQQHAVRAQADEFLKTFDWDTRQ